MSETAPRPASTVDTLKALADPTRLNLLSALMRTRRGELRVMSVKELAAELGEPQTKLYRHVKQLEAAGLIRVAATRVVSGIVEQRYQACQNDLLLGGEASGTDKSGAEMEGAVTAIMELYRTRFFAAQRAAAERDQLASAEDYQRQLLTLHETRLPVAKAAEFRDRLNELVTELNSWATDDDDAGTVPVNVLLGYFSPLE